METEILVYVVGKAVPHRHLVPPETTFEAVVAKLREDGVITGEMVIAEEDRVEEIILSELVGAGGRHQRILHCHHCRHIHVTVEHPDAEPPGPLEHDFQPGTRVGLVKNWAVHQLPNLDNAAKWCLRGPDGEILDNELHIGTLASHPGCALGLSLTEHHKSKG
jgi:hypothetical protein